MQVMKTKKNVHIRTKMMNYVLGLGTKSGPETSENFIEQYWAIYSKTPSFATSPKHHWSVWKKKQNILIKFNHNVLKGTCLSLKSIILMLKEKSASVHCPKMAKTWLPVG